MEAWWLILLLKSVDVLHVCSFTYCQDLAGHCHRVTCQVLPCWPMCRHSCLCILLTASILWLKRISAPALCCCSSCWLCSPSCTQQLWPSGSQIQEKCCISPKPASFHVKVKEKREWEEEVRQDGFLLWDRENVAAWALYNLGKALAGILRREMGEHGEISLRFLGAYGWLQSLFRLR